MKIHWPTAALMGFCILIGAVFNQGLAYLMAFLLLLIVVDDD